MKKKSRFLIYPLLTGLILILTYSCKKKEELPSLATSDVTEITATTATSGGNITSDGGGVLINRGVCWDTLANPTIVNSKTINGKEPGSFTSAITGLKEKTTYYVRAYATSYFDNIVGTAYGNEISFTTKDIPFPDRKGWWKFDDPANLVKAEIGAPLELVGVMESVDGPIAGNKAINIGVGSYLKMAHGISANGGGTRVNEYSLQIDFSVPPMTGSYLSFFEINTNTGGSTDGDLFISAGRGNVIGVGDAGYSSNPIVPDTWYRMILSIKNGEFWKLYINGELWIDGDNLPVDGRYALRSILFLFADDDGEDLPINCSEAGIWDAALTAGQVAKLGNASHQ